MTWGSVTAGLPAGRCAAAICHPDPISRQPLAGPAPWDRIPT
jgi:hypothetical protein